MKPTGTPKVPCPECGGSGEIEYEGVVGYVTRDMASDGGCPEREGDKVMGTIRDDCPACNGFGYFNVPIDEEGTINGESNNA